MTPAPSRETGQPALVLPDFSEAFIEVGLITRIMRGLGERMILGASGENEDADLFVFLAERLEVCHERLDRAVRPVPPPKPKGGAA